MPQPNEFYSFTIPGGYRFEIRGITNAGAGQRFVAHIPAHTQPDGTEVAAQATHVNGGGPPDNKPMNPPVINGSTNAPLPISLEFHKHHGGADWRPNNRWTIRTNDRNRVVIGVEDGADTDYNDTVVTVTWSTFGGV